MLLRNLRRSKKLFYRRVKEIEIQNLMFGRCKIASSFKTCNNRKLRIMNKVIQFIILSLKKILIFFENKVELKNIDDKDALTSLAPKIILDKNELKKIQPYLVNIKKAINTKGINNIAITGSYGSGKSTVLKTFQHYNPEFEYLNISLASFKDNKVDSGQNDFERKLEISILQQIFYHVKPSKIPDSRFKRIINLTAFKLFFQTLFLLFWVLSLIILFKFNYINKLNPLGWVWKYKLDWLTVILIVVFFIGIGLFVKSIVRLFSNSKISKFNIKGEIELGETIDKSVFNQHLEEILYFFERTKFNVVVIEDVDRFDNTDIFTKLREINILINYSNSINRKVSFIYAIKDEMFTDKNERVKFFEFIIPVIPFINPSNAGEQLTKMINASNLEGALSPEFTDDVITFVDDIDMRLLINIFHEYQLYRENLSKDLEQDNLFAMIVYKNIFPDDFGDLPRRKGNLYKILSNKKVYINSLVTELGNKIENIEKEIKTIESELKVSTKELRAVYINAIISKISGFSSFRATTEISQTEALEENNFKELIKQEKILCNRYIYNYGNNYVLQSNDPGLKFSNIEKEISPTLTYVQREKLLENKKADGVNRLKIEKENLKNKIREIESLSIAEIFEQIEIDDYLESFKDNYLVRNLLLNGYLNENYNDYISLFHEVNLTKEDFEFERKVKSGQPVSFDYRLSKTENLIKRLADKYFKREVALNYCLLDSLLVNKNKYFSKLENFLKLLSIDNEKNFQFILGYIDRKADNESLFIELLVKYKSTLWSYLKNKSDAPDQRVKEILKLIFENANVKDIHKLKETESLKSYFEDMNDVVEYSTTFSTIEKLKEFIQLNSLSFHQLDLPKQAPCAIFEYVYNNNNYQLTTHNIETIIKYYGKEHDLEKLNRAHYTTLKKTGLTGLLTYISINIEEYINNVMLKLPENNNEEETTIIELLNNDLLSNDLRSEIVVSQYNELSKLSYIDELEVKEIVLKNNKIIPTWQNIFNYYDSYEDPEIDDTLIDYLNNESNSSHLSLSKLNIVKEKDEKFIESFSLKLIHCKELKIEAYTNLLKSIPYVYNSVRYEDLDLERIELMISTKFVTLSIENYNGIKGRFPNSQIKLLEVYQDSFVKRYEDFSLDENDWLLLMKSSLFTRKNKLEIIEKWDDSIIVDNSQIANVICHLLFESEYIPLRFEVLAAMFDSNNSVQTRIYLLNLHFDNLDDSQIQALSKKLGEDYANLFLKQHKPTFKNMHYNEELFKKLKDRNLISSYSVNEKKAEIRVVANY